MKNDQGTCADCLEHDFIQLSHEGDRPVCPNCFEKYAPILERPAFWDQGIPAYDAASFEVKAHIHALQAHILQLQATGRA